MGLPLVVGRAAVKELARKQKLSLEMAGRGLRHGFLARTARQRHIPTVALAHHADDQLELFFLRLLRGSGGEGLAGMRWRTRSASDTTVQLVRPLLDQPKAVLLKYAVERGVCYREDTSNALLDFQRNRIRHELLPLLRRKYQPALDKTISRVMEIVGAEAEFAARAAAEWLAGRGGAKSDPSSVAVLRRVEVRSPKGGRRLGSKEDVVSSRPCLTFDELPLAVQRRCLRLQLVNLGVVPDFELVERLRSRGNRAVEISRAQFPGEARAGEAGREAKACIGAGTARMPVLRHALRDSSGCVHLEVAEPVEFNSSSAQVDLDCSTREIEFGGARISWGITSSGAGVHPAGRAGKECFDADEVGSPIWLRHWRPGDRFQPIGMKCPVKLQDFFTNQKIPRAMRRRLIVATTAAGVVFWVEGLRISERFKLTKQTIRRLQWRWKRR